MLRHICLCLSLPALVAAQPADRRMTVPGGHSASARTAAQHDGSFEFSALDSGAYEFRLTSPAGDVVARTFGSVPGGREVRFELPASQPPAAPVSLYRLSHHIPSKARKAMRQAVKSLDQGKFAKAIAHLDAALAADPDFADALHLRGILALQDKDYPRAHACLVRAAQLDDANPRILANAAVIRYMAREPQDAARLASAALRLDPQLETARIVLRKIHQAAP